MGWKESGLERIGWGSYPHVLLQEFLTWNEELTVEERFILRYLIIYGEVSLKFISERLQKHHPESYSTNEAIVFYMSNIKKALRTFYTLSLNENFSKAELLYHMHSDNTHKADSEKIVNANLVRKTQVGNEALSEIYKITPYRGENIFGTSELRYYRSRIRKNGERKEKCDPSLKET